MSDEFYIGYAPPMPPRLARFTTRIVIVTVMVVAVVASWLALGHTHLEGGRFDFGHPSRVSGIIVEHPYPALRPAASAADDGATRWTLLVAPGKHGAEALVKGLDGQAVTLQGARIERGNHVMLELSPGSVAPGASASAASSVGVPATSATASARPSAAGLSPADAAADLAPDTAVTLNGEVVDTKCFLGVMVPGEGTTHKDCASLCLRGGIPAGLFVRDREGRTSLLLLEDASGAPVGRQALGYAGEAVEITGVTARQGGWLHLRSDPATWRRLDALSAR